MEITTTKIVQVVNPTQKKLDALVVGNCPNCGRDLTVSECSILEGKEV